MPTNNQDIIIHQPPNREVSDIIGNPPSWLLRSGIGMVAFVFTIIMVISSFFQYPDKIEGTGILTSASPPIELISQTHGYIEEVLVDDGQKVMPKEKLFYINNSTNPDDIDMLNKWIKQYQAIKSPNKYLNISFPSNLQLGKLQNDYASLSLKFKELRQTLNDSIPIQQTNNLSSEILKISELNQSQEREKSIYLEEFSLGIKDFKRNQALATDGVISIIEVEQAEAKLLQMQRQYESMKNTIIQNNIRIEQLELEKLKIHEDKANLIKSYQFTIDEIIVRIQANIEQWNQTYIIESPLDGIVSLKTDYYENSFIQANDVLGYILPIQNQEKYLLCQVPIYNAGKLEANQKVITKLDAFPYKEFGMLLGKVNDISRIPNRDKEGNAYYNVKIPIADSIYTDIGYLIPYKPNMTAQVEIITENKTILQRIFNQFLSLIKQQQI